MNQVRNFVSLTFTFLTMDVPSTLLYHLNDGYATVNPGCRLQSYLLSTVLSSVLYSRGGWGGVGGAGRGFHSLPLPLAAMNPCYATASHP